MGERGEHRSSQVKEKGAKKKKERKEKGEEEAG